MPELIRPLLLALCACVSLVAQQPTLPVQDLLRPAPTTDDGGSRGWLTRSYPGNPYRDFADWSWHRLIGETRLVPIAADDLTGEVTPPFRALNEDGLRELLAALRGAEDPSIDFARDGRRVLMLTDYPEQSVASLRRIRQLIPSPIDVMLTLERIGEDGDGAVLLFARDRVRDGELVIVSDAEDRQVVYEFDVEIAGSSSIANPNSGTVRYGAAIGLRVRQLPFGDGAVVETIVRTCRPLESEPLRPSASLGPLDRVASRVDEAGLTFRVTRGAPVVHEWTDLEGELLRLTCDLDWETRPEPRTNEPRVACSSLFGEPVLGFREALRAPEDAQLEEIVIPITPLVERIEDDLVGRGLVSFSAGEADSGGALVLTPDADGALFERIARQRIDAALRRASLVLEIVDLPLGSELTVDGPLPEDAQIIGRIRGPLLAELPSCFASAREQSYLSDYSPEIASLARISDPRIDVVEDGWFATVWALEGGAGRITELQLDLEVRKLIDIRSIDTTLGGEIRADSSGEGGVGTIYLPQEVVTIEQPVTRSARLLRRLRLDDAGRVIAIQSARKLLGEGRALAIRATLTP